MYLKKMVDVTVAAAAHTFPASSCRVEENGET
jgi:hypothetical protein